MSFERLKLGGILKCRMMFVGAKFSSLVTKPYPLWQPASAIGRFGWWKNSYHTADWVPPSAGTFLVVFEKNEGSKGNRSEVEVRTKVSLVMLTTIVSYDSRGVFREMSQDVNVESNPAYHILNVRIPGNVALIQKCKLRNQ